MTTMRLDKFLADCGCGTRSEVKKEIRKHTVTVNGTPAADGARKVDPERDQICWQGRRLRYSRFQYIMLYKPAGCVSAVTDRIHKTVMDLLPSDIHKNMAPAGRLDIDTEGLLLITDDGELVHDLLAPGRHVEKTYYAEIDGLVTEKETELFARGVDIGDPDLTRPARLKILSQGPGSEILLTITEGRFHQVKRMFQAVGMKVRYLKRISMGSLRLDETLGPGGYRFLTDEEIKNLKKKEHVC